MKIIELIDEELWMIDVLEKEEKVKYLFSDKVYSNLELICITTDISVDYSFLEGAKLNAPNLRVLYFSGEGSKSCFHFFCDPTFFAPSLEEVYLTRTGINELPDFISKIKTLKKLNFREEKLSEIPDIIFTMVTLESLSFEYFWNIKIVSDKIKHLVNLQNFDLWGASIEYLSPELFLLPKIHIINFAYSSYQPTNEVLDAMKIFQKNESVHFSKWKF